MPKPTKILNLLLLLLFLLGYSGCDGPEKTRDQKLAETRNYYNSPSVIGAFMEPAAFGKYRWHATFQIRDLQGKILDENQYLMRNSKFTKKTQVLDWGCGMGWLAVEIAKRCHCRVTGLNISEIQLKKAKEWAIRNRVQDLVNFDLYDGLKLPYADSSFDIVYSQEALVNAPDKEFSYREIFRVLKPRGELSIQDWYADARRTNWAELTKEIDEEHKSTMTTFQNADELLRLVGFTSVKSADIRDLAPQQLQRAFPNRVFARAIESEAFTVAFTFARKPDK